MAGDFNLTVVNLSAVPTTWLEVTTLDRFLHVFPLVLLMTAIIVFNVSLIGVIASTPALHTTTNLFIVSLAVSDLLAGVVVIPVNLAVPTALFYGYTTCMYAACATTVVAIASMTNILAVTSDRYFAITAPLHYRVRMRPAVAMAIVVVTWVYALLLGLLPVMGWRVTQSTCFRGETYPPYYTLLIFFSGCILPVWGSGIMYVRIFTLVRRHQQRIVRTGHRGQGQGHALRHNDSVVSFVSPPSYAEQPGAEGTVRMVRRKSSGGSVFNWTSTNQKTLKTLAILMVYFEVSWLPVFVVMVTDAFINPRLLPSWVHSLFGTLAFVNCALDPLIYGYRNKDIKNSFTQRVEGLTTAVAGLVQRHGSPDEPPQ